MSYAAAMQQLPLAAPADLLGRRGLVVVAPHPDDETLGCGGLLAWASRHRLLRHVVYLTLGEKSHPHTTCNLAAIRRAEAIVAASHLGLLPTQLSFLGLPDAGLLTLSDGARLRAMHWLRALVTERSPCVVAVTTDTDPHGDHRAAFALVRDAIRGMTGVELLTYPVWSWLLPDAPGPVAGLRVDIRDYRTAKDSAIDAYASQRGERVFDVDGFSLPKELLHHVNTDTEVFLRPVL